MFRIEYEYLTPMLKRVIALVFLFLLTGIATAKEPCPTGTPQLIIYHAGSLSAALSAIEDLYTQQSGVCVVDVAGGSVSLARQVTAGKQTTDLIAIADYEVIDQMLKPAGFANYSIRFASGAMVLAYTTSSKNAETIAKSGGKFVPPNDIPEAASDWYKQLTQPGVTIAGSHPFLDPGAYRADMIFQLAQDHYGVPNLYNEMLSHYTITKEHGGLGKIFDYQFTYEHGARAAYKADKTGTYRYVKLPDEINLGVSGLNSFYAKHSVTMPGLQTEKSAATVSIPASRVSWGITLMNAAPNRENALAFLQLLFSRQSVAIMNDVGPTAISPPIVSKQDFLQLPASLKAIVQSQ
jgi:molybdate/tungstate transport system substrate-binding protein